MIAEAPQTEVPAAISWANLRSMPIRWPSHTVNMKVQAKVTTMIARPNVPTLTSCANDSCRPSRTIASRRIRRMLNTTPGLRAPGMPTVLRKAMPSTIAMISGLSTVMPNRLRSSNATAATVKAKSRPGSRRCPAAQYLTERLSAANVKLCITSSYSLAGQPRHRKIQRSPARDDLRGRIRLRRSDQQDECRLRLGPANREHFAHQKETERRLLTKKIAGIGHDAEQNIVLGTADCALDRAFHCVAFDELDDPPTIPGQLDHPFGCQERRGRLTILRRPHQIEDCLRDSGIVDYCVGCP